ncbi:hypothetical protein Tco_0886968 [Tanacetum coccineum]
MFSVMYNDKDEDVDAIHPDEVSDNDQHEQKSSPLMVLETLAALDRAINSPYATTQMSGFDMGPPTGTTLPGAPVSLLISLNECASDVLMSLFLNELYGFQLDIKTLYRNKFAWNHECFVCGVTCRHRMLEVLVVILTYNFFQKHMKQSSYLKAVARGLLALPVG